MSAVERQASAMLSAPLRRCRLMAVLPGQRRQDLGTAAGAGVVTVLVEGHVAQPVHAVVG